MGKIKEMFSVAVEVVQNFGCGPFRYPENTAQRIINQLYRNKDNREKLKEEYMSRFSNEQLQKILESADEEGKRYARNEMARRAKK